MSAAGPSQGAKALSLDKARDKPQAGGSAPRAAGERGGHIPWPAEQIWQEVMALGMPSLASFSVEILPEVDSTNTELMRRARAGRVEPTLLVAESQTAGRGRLGRGWVSSVGDSMTASLGLSLGPQSWDGLSLVVGISLAESLHEQIQLKWPNDLFISGRKLGGILVETTTWPSAGPSERFAVVGMGLNIALPHSQDPLRTPPAALQSLDPGLSASVALGRIASRLVTDLMRFEREGFAAFTARFARRDALAERTVELSDGTQGIARGVDETGALLVHTAGQLQRVTSSEVSVRPLTP
jgi:BirA family transcriptional regulator, biotin operon repressor / biotin---[acetyl-CoA-carboxylase] ligase